MNETSYTAWDDNLYEWPPPDGWYQAADDKWWPEGYGPETSGEVETSTDGFDASNTTILGGSSGAPFDPEATAILPAGGADRSSPEQPDDSESQRPIYDELPSIDDVFGGDDPFSSDEDVDQEVGAEEIDDSDQRLDEEHDEAGSGVTVDDLIPASDHDRTMVIGRDTSAPPEDVSPALQDQPHLGDEAFPAVEESAPPSDHDQDQDHGNDHDHDRTLVIGPESLPPPQDEQQPHEEMPSDFEAPRPNSDQTVILPIEPDLAARDGADVESELDQVMSPEPPVSPSGPDHFDRTVVIGDESRAVPAREAAMTAFAGAGADETDALAPGTSTVDPSAVQDHGDDEEIGIAARRALEAPPGPRSAWPLAIAGICLALVLVLLVGFFVLRDGDGDVAAEAGNVDQTAPTGLGSIDEPYAFGTGVVVFYDSDGQQRRWVVQVLSPIADGTEQFADLPDATPPADGDVLAFSRVRVTYQSGPAPGQLNDLSLNAIGASLTGYSQEDDRCSAVTDQFNFNAELQPTDSVEGNLCWRVSEGDLADLKLAIEAGPADGTVHLSLS